MSVRRMTCPYCKGRGGAMYYFTGDEGVPGTSGLHPARCHICNGDGVLSSIRSYLHMAGRRLARYRNHRGLSFSEMAEELDVEPGDVQCMEKGMFSIPCVLNGYTREQRQLIWDVMNKWVDE